MHDSTETARRHLIATGQPVADLAADTGEKWTIDTLMKDFTVIGFLSPFVVVRRKSDDKVGTLEFTNRPRVYFGWQEVPGP